jgi:hypothetical protein
MYQLKPLSKAAVPAALEKAERYRLLNEPGEAVSICQDVLAVEPTHQHALVILLLALTDQLADEPAVASRAQQVARSLDDEYERLHRREIGEGAPAAGRRFTGRRVRVAGGCDGLLHARRSRASAWQRRCDSAVERVREAAHGIPEAASRA